MDLTLDRSTHVGLGYAAQADAFQSGREAAQMAKSQLPDGRLDLAVVLAPGNVHFKDFVEGVRLVTGDETLLGVPVTQTLSTEHTSPDACLVLLLRFAATRATLSFADMA